MSVGCVAGTVLWALNSGCCAGPSERLSGPGDAPANCHSGPQAGSRNSGGPRSVGAVDDTDATERVPPQNVRTGRNPFLRQAVACIRRIAGSGLRISRHDRKSERKAARPPVRTLTHTPTRQQRRHLAAGCRLSFLCCFFLVAFAQLVERCSRSHVSGRIQEAQRPDAGGTGGSDAVRVQRPPRSGGRVRDRSRLLGRAPSEHRMHRPGSAGVLSGAAGVPIRTRRLRRSETGTGRA